MGKIKMKKTVKLPLYNDFMDIFENHEVKNWQAKNFWEVMKFNIPDGSQKFKRQMYTGLKVLLTCEYLKIDSTRSSKQLFIYNETPRLEELRNRYKNEKLTTIFSSKKTALIELIEEKEENIKFINDLVSADNSLERYFIDIIKMLEKDIRKFKSNIKLMDEIINR